MKVYCAGPMSGYPLYNRQAFADAEVGLRLQGHEVVNPHKLTENWWRTRYGTPFDYNSMVTDEDYKSLLAHDIIWLSQCDTIHLLKGWQDSKGARTELAFAEACGIEVLNKDETECPLDKAKKIVNGDRQKYYGHPIDNHGNTAEMWRSWLYRKFGVDIPIEAEDVCWLMVLLKCSREANLSHADNLVDVVGYVANVHMIQQERGRRCTSQS